MPEATGAEAVSDPLAPGARLAWKVAAAEAGGARHEFIESGHCLIGILSLEKLVDAKAGLGLPPATLAAARIESDGIETLLRRTGLNATRLRRGLRQALGTGAHVFTGQPISRSPSLKLAFKRARTLAGDTPINSLHLLAALLEEPDATVAGALQSAGARALDVVGPALAGAETVADALLAGPPPPQPQPPTGAAPASPAPAGKADLARRLEPILSELQRAVRETHGVTLRVTPEAAAFVVEQGFHPDHGVSELAGAVERWVQGPLSALVRSGKIRRHSAWALVYDEGGVYLIPDADHS